MRILFKADKTRQLGEEFRKVKTGGIINRGLRKLYRIIEPALKSETPVAFAKLRNSTRGQILYDGKRQVLSVRQGAKTDKGAFYGRFVREGRQPGKMPPVSALEPWVIKKLGVPQKRAHSVAFVIARKISKQGIPANEYHVRTLNRLRPQIQAVASEMASDIVAVVRTSRTGG